jgi:hypothetical protein
MMKRIHLLFAALLVAAIAVPGASAQTVHFAGAGSSAMFQGFMVAAYNDLATDIVTANPGFTIHHWTKKSSTAPGTWGGAVDSRTPSGGSPPPVEYGNVWVVWVDNASGTPTDIWTDLSIDSTVGNRVFLATPRAKLLLAAADTSTAGDNAIANTLLVGGAVDDPTLDTNVYNALGGATGFTLTAGLTDIRPEDALLATNKILGTVPAAGFPSGHANACPPQDTGVPGAASPTCSDFPYFYSFALGYGPGPIGAQIKSAYSSTAATPVAFGLPGFPDPITTQTVPSTVKIFPVGEAPIVLLANRSNASGLGQVIGNHPDCGVAPLNQVNCIPGGYTSDGSYYVRNMWDQHPYPPTGAFPSTSFPSTGYCSVPANQGSATCHITRRPLGNLFAGNLCEGRNTAFSWPLDPALEGARTTIPNGVDFPLTLVQREPLSGTYSTFEFDEVRRMGTTNGNLTLVGGLYGKPPYISEESNVQIANPNNNPLSIACQAGFGDTDTEGLRKRAIGTGELVNTGVFGTADSIGYAFFSFSNVSKLAASTKYGYLLIDGIDPIFNEYSNTTGNPGQPAVTGSPLTWGELPKCVPGGTPDCKASAIWVSGNSYPHLRDGTYPAWSELRLLCDTSDATCETDANGAQALIQHLQADIHFDNLGGVPDLLPFAGGGPAVFGNGAYGDASFVRTHYKFVSANDYDLFNNIAPYSNATPATTHMSNTMVVFGGAGTCPTANQPVNGPAPVNECGGDAGGWIIAAPPAGGASNGQIQ